MSNQLLVIKLTDERSTIELPGTAQQPYFSFFAILLLFTEFYFSLHSRHCACWTPKAVFTWRTSRSRSDSQLSFVEVSVRTSRCLLHLAVSFLIIILKISASSYCEAPCVQLRAPVPHSKSALNLGLTLHHRAFLRVTTLSQPKT